MKWAAENLRFSLATYTEKLEPIARPLSRLGKKSPQPARRLLSLPGQGVSTNGQNPFAPASCQWGGCSRPPWTGARKAKRRAGTPAPLLKQTGCEGYPRFSTVSGQGEK